MAMTKSEALVWAERYGSSKTNEDLKVTNQKTKKTAFRHGRPWTDRELKILMEWEGEEVDLAEKLCRTLFAVRSRKSMIAFCQKHRTES